MNCGDFQERFQEYVEGSLSAGARAQAERHLAGCDACREIVRREQQFAERLRGSLQRETETLTLGAGVRRNILTAAIRAPAPSTLRETAMNFLRRFAWQTATAAALLIVAGFWLNHFFPAAIKTTEPVRTNNAGQLAASAQRPGVSIQITHHVPTMTFRREGNLVIDTLGYETILASETINPGRLNFEP